MVFEDLRVKPQTRAVSAWANAVVDALEQTYALAKRGDPDSPYDELHAKNGYFSEGLYVQGKPVIKDGDPITVSDLGDSATQKITQAIDSSATSQNIASIKDKVNRINMDESGNIGVFPASPITVGDISDTVKQKIAQAVDASQILADIKREFEPVSEKGSVSAADNTSGLQVVLDKGGRPFVNVYFNLGGAGRVYIKVSNDGSKWRTLDVIDLPEGGEDIKTYAGVTFRYVRVETDVAGIDVEFEVSASR